MSPSRATNSSSIIGKSRTRSATWSNDSIVCFFLDLLLDEPLQEDLARVIASLARNVEELADRDGIRALLFERGLDRGDVVVEGAAGCLDLTEVELAATLEQVVDDLHRVPPLLVRLLVEELRELRERLGVVVRADRDVLMGGGELPRDLFVERSDEPFRRRHFILLGPGDPSVPAGHLAPRCVRWEG